MVSDKVSAPTQSPHTMVNETKSQLQPKVDIPWLVTKSQLQPKVHIPWLVTKSQLQPKVHIPWLMKQNLSSNPKSTYHAIMKMNPASQMQVCHPFALSTALILLGMEFMSEFILLFGMLAHSAERAALKCGLLPADFIFLLDSSGSETAVNFQKQVEFLKNFTSRFTIGPNNTQFSSVTFSTGVRNDFDLNENQNQQELQSAINKISYMNGETETHLALNFAKTHSIAVQYGGRPGVQKYIVVMTDGKSNEPNLTVNYANVLKQQPNVTIIALGIGSAVDTSELQAIATDSKHVFTVSNFDLLNVLEKELTDTTCTVCGDEPADLVFLLDSSGSEGSRNFQLQRQFVSLVVNEFDISATGTQVGLGTFATTARTQISLQQYPDKASLLRAIAHVSYSDGETRTDLGLQLVQNDIFRSHGHHHVGPRAGAKRFVVVLTDGRSNEEQLTVRAAESLKQHVDEVFAIGIGNAVDKHELNSIATNDGQHVFNVKHFNNLDSIHGNIVKEICEHRIPPPTTTPIPTTVTTTPTTTTTVKPECGPKPADIVFVLDSSESEKQENFTKQINFVYNFAKRFEIGPDNVQFSTVTFSSEIRNDFYLNTYHRRNNVLHAIQNLKYMGAGTNTSLALKFVRENSFLPANGGRENASHIVIVITDGQSADPTSTAKEANSLKHSVNKVFAIGIGDQLDTAELSTIASNHHPLTVTNFDLLHTIQESLENAAFKNGTFVAKVNRYNTPASSPICQCSLGLPTSSTMFFLVLVVALCAQLQSVYSAASIVYGYINELLYRIECGLLPADFIFLLDSSGSETSVNFKKQVDFLSNFSSQFTIGPKNTQFASITFSTGVRGDFDLDENGNQQDLQNAIKHIHYVNGETATHLALNYAKSHTIAEQNGGRPGVQKYVVVMTDGRSNEPQLTVNYANALKHQPNVTIIALGIGSAVDNSELQAIATDSKHVFTVSNFDLLHVLEKELVDTTCTLCGDQPADIVFLLDSSGSEGNSNFQLQKQFVSSVINDFEISRTDTQVGLVTFSTSATAEIHLQQYNTKPSLIHAVQQVTYKNGETRTDIGLTTVERNIFHTHHNQGPRHGAKRFVIVLTDGRSNEEDLTARAAHSLKRHVDEVFAIGIGHAVDRDELNNIATDDHHHVFTAGNFHDLLNLQGNIVKEICEHRVVPPTTTARPTTKPTTKPTTVTTTPTTTTTVKPECGDKPADIVFVLDSSESEKQENFTKQINFVYNFAKRFEIGPDNVQFSTVTFSSEIRNDFYLNTYHRRNDVLHAIQNLKYMGAGTNTSLALKFVRENSFLPANGGRKNASHIVIVITDGQSADPTSTAKEANSLKHSVNNVFAIGIGDKLDTTELSTIASNHHPLTVTNFDLLHTIQGSLENAACND
ncbi:collagen alpha-1(XII) chain-like [Ylistrum balloti]|uniref:collagen alpha-1(XII) chain-like n=1 Tax=Ylistrum balloti TaxID=509963 RepID=UPI0029059246|nr:collagen alpha-1(XII) chain-like [Ylistrum balloti]